MSLTFKTPDEIEKHQSCYTQNTDLKEYFADMDELMMAEWSEESILLDDFLKVFVKNDFVCSIGVDFPEIFDRNNRFRHAMLRYTK